MRVLEAFGEPVAYGGQEAFVFNVLEHMDLSGLTVDCLTAYTCDSERYKALAEKLGGGVYALGLPFAPGKSRRNIAAPFRAFLREHRYDVVHIHSGSISVLAIMAAEADKAGVRRVIVHSHAAGDRESWKHKVLRALASLYMRSHVGVYCACSRVAAEWKFAPDVAAKARIVKNGIDIGRFAFDADVRRATREKLGLDEADYVVGHVGRFSRQKNHAFLVDAFAEMARRAPECRLLLVGDGEDRLEITRRIAEMGLADRVAMTGAVDNVADYLQAMDVFVLPSLYEGLPISAVEAVGAGLPVVLSDAITREVGFSEDVVFLPLEAGSGAWADAVLRFRGRARADGAETVRQAGFDIVDTAREIRELYLG